MIAFDSCRNIIQDMSYIEKDHINDEFLIIDDIKSGEYHFENYSSDKLLYLGEYDFFYSIYDLEKELLSYAPIKRNNNISWIAGPLLTIIEFPMLEKLLKNKGITKSNASQKIKERDNYCCQLCGETDERVLNVHHIVPRKSPFLHEEFIHSPINQITLCANCHRIEHYVLENGNAAERKEHVERLFNINGAHFWDFGGHLYESMDTIKEYNQMDVFMR